MAGKAHDVAVSRQPACPTTALYARPRLAGPVRRLLATLAWYAEHADGLRVFRRRDPEENARCALPDGERPMLAAIWTVELYTPSSVAGLLDALERHTWLRTGGGTDPARWIQDHRGRPGAGGWMTLARVVPPNPKIDGE